MFRNPSQSVVNGAGYLFLILFLIGYSEIAVGEENSRPEAETAEKYQLNYQFKVGDFVHYRVRDSSSYTTQKDSISETAKNQSTAWRQYRVVSVDQSGEAVLELMIERVRLQAQFDDSPPIVFDSTDPELQPESFKQILQTVGKPMSRIRVDRYGNLLEVHNYFGKQPKQADPALNFLVVFPQKPIAINETWKQDLEVEVPVSKTLREKVKLRRIYQLKSVEKDLATISLSTILVTPIRDPAVKVRLMQMTPSGTIQFDMKRHLLISRKVKIDDQIVGAFGAGTLVKAVSVREEVLQPGKVAQTTEISTR